MSGETLKPMESRTVTLGLDKNIGFWRTALGDRHTTLGDGHTILYNSFGTHGQLAVSQNTQFHDCPHNYIISSAYLGLL